MLTSKRIIAGILVLLIDLLISIFIFTTWNNPTLVDKVLTNQSISRPENNIINTAVNNKVINHESPLAYVTKKSNTLPEELNAPKEEEKFLDPVTNESIIRIKGKVVETISPQKIYLILLDNNQTVTGEINSGTLIAKAWYGYDSNNILILTQYDTIPLSDLNSVQNNTNVSVIYREKDFSLTKNIPLSEFILL